MKILILGFSKIKYMPYMNFYIENINTKENDVHLLYWNRDLKEEDLSACPEITFHEFNCYQEDDVSKLSKISSFIKYRNFASKILKNGNFDFVIVLHSLPAVLVANTLKKGYKNKFIFDYRDSTYEGFAPFKKIVGTIVKNSSATFVSSDGFRRFLPESEKDKIYTSHNLLTDSLSHRDEKRINGIPSDKIRIAFWGFIRHEDINKEIIKKIAVDDRFELHYYGREQQIALNLKEYAKELSAENVFFHGEYKPEERYEFVRNTDIIHNIYFDNNTMLAMGNKYYDSAVFYIPQICMKGSFMGKMSEKAGIGFECDPYDDNFMNKLYAYYNNINFTHFKNNCDDELKRVREEFNKGCFIIKELCNK